MVDLPNTMVDLLSTMLVLPTTMTVLTVFLNTVFDCFWLFFYPFCPVLTLSTIFDHVDLSWPFLHTDPWLFQGAWWSAYRFMHFCWSYIAKDQLPGLYRMFDSPVPESWVMILKPLFLIKISTKKETVQHYGNTFYSDCPLKAKTGIYAEFSFQETKSLSSYAGLSGCQPTRDFTHSWTFINFLST